MAKGSAIVLGDKTRIPIIYEDSVVLAVDKPAGWMLAPSHWDRTSRNLQRALESSIQAGAFWARTRRLHYLRFIHRLDADTSGALLLARSPAALRAMSRLFAQNRVQKLYLAVVQGHPEQAEWTCDVPIGRQPGVTGKMQPYGIEPKRAFTSFTLLQTKNDSALVLAQPRTGRTHQIRVHLAASGLPILGDPLYNTQSSRQGPLGLRSMRLAYRCPRRHHQVAVQAPCEQFLLQFGFDPCAVQAIAHDHKVFFPPAAGLQAGR